MADFMAEPARVLPDRESLLQALLTLDWFCATETDGRSARYATKSVWMCELIEKMFIEKGQRFVYNYEVKARAGRELRLEVGDPHTEGDPLSALVYNAQRYVRSDHLRALGYEPLTQMMVDRAHREGAQIELIGSRIAHPRSVRGVIYAFQHRSRTKTYAVDGSVAARLLIAVSQNV